MSSIRERIIAVEKHFLDALQDDVPSVEQFCLAWEELSRSMQSHPQDEEIVKLAHVVASRIGIISQDQLDYYTKATDIASALQSELDRVFAKLYLTDFPSRGCVQNPLHPSVLSPPPTPADTDRREPDLGLSSIPPYIEPAYRWLLENIHDPYPSNDVKQYISSSTGTDVQHVNAWFMNVRRRMGWTALARKYFSGNRADTADAAYRALVQDDPKRSLEYRVRSDFAKMKVDAECLYSGKLRKSVLASRLDVAVKDLTDGDRIAHTTKVNNSATANPELSYPSPHRTPSPTPELVIPPRPCEEDSSPPRAVIGHKRRMSSSSTDFSDICLGSSSRPNKRFRPVSTTPTTTLPPFPQSSASTTIQVPDSYEGVPPSTEDIASTSSISRKRRLSDSDSHPPPKRPRGSQVGPRLAVSNPLPLSYPTRDIPPFEEWFKMFDFPEPVTTNDLDSSTPVDVDIYQDWTFLSSVAEGVESIQSLTLPNLDQQADCDVGSQAAISATTPVSVGCPAYDFTTQVPSPESECDIDVSTQATSICPEVQPIETTHCTVTDNLVFPNDHFFCPPLVADCSSPSSPFENDLSLVFNIDDLLSLPKWSLISSPEDQAVEAQSPSIPGFDGLELIDGSWASYTPALPFDHNPNLPNSTQGFFDDIISQEPQDIDLSQFMPLAPSLPPLLSHDSYQLMAEKQAKLEQLQKHREEVRKLEAELAL